MERLLIVFVVRSDRSHCLLMFDAVNKTSNDMEFSSSVQNGNQPNCGKNLKSKLMELATFFSTRERTGVSIRL